MAGGMRSRPPKWRCWFCGRSKQSNSIYFDCSSNEIIGWENVFINCGRPKTQETVDLQTEMKVSIFLRF